MLLLIFVSTSIPSHISLPGWKLYCSYLHWDHDTLRCVVVAIVDSLTKANIKKGRRSIIETKRNPWNYVDRNLNGSQWDILTFISESFIFTKIFFSFPSHCARRRDLPVLPLKHEELSQIIIILWQGELHFVSVLFFLHRIIPSPAWAQGQLKPLESHIFTFWGLSRVRKRESRKTLCIAISIPSAVYIPSTPSSSSLTRAKWR